MLIEQVETLRQNLLTVTRKVRALRLKEEYAEKYDALTSIPGIGPICAITLLTEIYDVKRFRNERQFASYLGLVPTCHSSGEKASFGEMTFRGNKHLGPLLIYQLQTERVDAPRVHHQGCTETIEYHLRNAENRESLCAGKRIIQNIIRLSDNFNLSGSFKFLTGN